MSTKKLLCLLTALVMVFALASCAKGGFEDKLNDTLNPDGGEPSGDQGQSDDDPGTDPAEDPGTDPSGDTGGESEGFDYTAFSDGLDENGFFENVRALDYVTLPDYKGMELPKFAGLTDRAVEDGDFVNIDYVGSVDGVEFAGGSTQGMGTDVIIGVTSYIDDFLQQIIGHTPGENFDIEVTFPENYAGNDDLSGKDAVFNITVNCIWDVTDEKAAAIGFTDKNEMAQYMAGSGATMDSIAQNAAVNAVITASKCESVPDSVHDAVHTQLEGILTLQASQYGLDADTYVMYVYGSASLEDYLASQVPAEATWDLIFQAIAEQEGMTVSDEDIASAGFADYVEIYERPYVAFSVLQTKVSRLINGGAELADR